MPVQGGPCASLLSLEHSCNIAVGKLCIPLGRRVDAARGLRDDAGLCTLPSGRQLRPEMPWRPA